MCGLPEIEQHRQERDDVLAAFASTRAARPLRTRRLTLPISLGGTGSARTIRAHHVSRRFA